MKRTCIARTIGSFGVKYSVLGAVGCGLGTSLLALGLNRMWQDPVKPATWKEDLEDAAMAGVEVGGYLLKTGLLVTGIATTAAVVIPSLLSNYGKELIHKQEMKQAENNLSVHAKSVLDSIRQRYAQDPHSIIIMEEQPLADQNIIKHLVVLGLLLMSKWGNQHLVALPRTSTLSNDEEEVLDQIQRMMPTYPDGWVPLSNLNKADADIIASLIMKGAVRISKTVGGSFIKDPHHTVVKVPSSTSN